MPQTPIHLFHFISQRLSCHSRTLYNLKQDPNLPIHTPIRCQPAHREQLGVQCLAPRHFDTWWGGVGMKLATFWLLNDSSIFWTTVTRCRDPCGLCCAVMNLIHDWANQQMCYKNATARWDNTKLLKSHRQASMKTSFSLWEHANVQYIFRGHKCSFHKL